MDAIQILFDDRPPKPRQSTHPACLPHQTLYAQCSMTRGRVGGPGGQHRNKTETLVHLRHVPTALEAHAGERRSPEANRRQALTRLRLILAVEHREPVPPGEARSSLWISRCKGGRIVCNPKHPDFPSLLSEAMDVVYACGLDVRKAAARLTCTMSQLVRFIARHPPALERLNRDRAARKLRPLKD